MAGSRKALLVVNDVYEHAGLRQLQAPAADAEALSRVLGDPAIGDFEVQVLHNEPAHVVQGHVEDLFADGRPDDLLLLHFSCHGLKSESGELFFAARSTRPDRLGSTAVPAAFVQRSMQASRARSVVLLLDCCYGGAFSQGVSVRAAGDAHVLDSFPGGRMGGGRGRAVITASSAMEYAFEGAELSDDHSRGPSVFTSAVVDGLATGEADRDQDGWVSLNELYDYVFDRVRAVNPHQTPSRDMEMQGELYLARGRAVVTPVPLPPELQDVVDHPLAGIRVGAVQELARLAHGPNAGLALGAQLALRRLVDDDSRTVSTAAAAALVALPAPTARSAGAAGAGAAAEGAAEHVPPPPGVGSGRLPSGATDRAVPSPGRGRRAWAAVAALLALGAVPTVLLLRDEDTPAGEGVLRPGEFTATAPWRLQVRDDIAEQDNGCLVTVTKGGAEVVQTTPVYETKRYQVQESGRFAWTANDPGCLVSVLEGRGSAALPFTQRSGGDTDAFESPPRVAVTVLDFHGNSGCELSLHDAETGQEVDFGEVTVEAGDEALLLDPSGRPQVYLTNVYCDVRVDTGPAAAS